MQMNKFELLNIIHSTCELTSKEVLVAQYFVYKSNKQGECYPSVETIAAHCGVSERTVQRATKKLQEKNYITIEKRYVNGKQSSNMYQINASLLQEKRKKSIITEMQYAENSDVVCIEEFAPERCMDYITFEELLAEENDSMYKMEVLNPVDNQEFCNEISIETTIDIEEASLVEEWQEPLEEVIFKHDSMTYYDYDEIDIDVIQFSFSITEQKDCEDDSIVDVLLKEKEVVPIPEAVRNYLWITLIIKQVTFIRMYGCWAQFKAVYDTHNYLKQYLCLAIAFISLYYRKMYMGIFVRIYREGFFVPFLGAT